MAFRADSGEEFDLMLGPVWFLQDNGIVLSQGEPVTVTASRVEPYDGGRHHGNGPGRCHHHLAGCRFGQDPIERRRRGDW